MNTMPRMDVTGQPIDSPLSDPINARTLAARRMVITHLTPVFQRVQTAAVKVRDTNHFSNETMSLAIELLAQGETSGCGCGVCPKSIARLLAVEVGLVKEAVISGAETDGTDAQDNTPKPTKPINHNEQAHKDMLDHYNKLTDNGNRELPW